MLQKRNTLEIENQKVGPRSHMKRKGGGWRWVDNLNGTKLQYILNGYFKYIAVTGFWCRKYKINRWESWGKTGKGTAFQSDIFLNT